MGFHSNHLWCSFLHTYHHSGMSHHSRTRTFLDHFHWVIHLQHQLVAFVNSRVWPSTVELTVNSSVKIILSDLGSTCNVMLSPAVLMLLVDWDQYFTVLTTQSLVITPAQFLREQDTGISLPHSPPTVLHRILSQSLSLPQQLTFQLRTS